MLVLLILCQAEVLILNVVGLTYVYYVCYGLVVYRVESMLSCGTCISIHPLAAMGNGAQ